MKTNFKAPEDLKNRTIQLMEREKTQNRHHPILMSVVFAAMFFTLSAFAFLPFSGIHGDELSLKAQYKTDGIVEVEIQNHSNRKLVLSDEVKLKRWSTSEDIGSYSAEIPKLGKNETAAIQIDVWDYEEKELLDPLPENDWYYFVFTNDRFQFGQDWMASFRFSDAEKDPIEFIEESELDSEISEDMPDSVSQETIEEILAAYTFCSPLKEMHITVKYGPTANGKKFSDGILIQAKKGEDVYAICDGEIVDTGFTSGDGKYIVIDHGNGLQSRYTHLEKTAAETGNQIAAGEKIGTAGKSGMASGTILGLKVYRQENPIDPEKILP